MISQTIPIKFTLDIIQIYLRIPSLPGKLLIYTSKVYFLNKEKKKNRQHKDRRPILPILNQSDESISLHFFVPHIQY